MSRNMFFLFEMGSREFCSGTVVVGLDLYHGVTSQFFKVTEEVPSKKHLLS